ncbi:MAG: hypothetical protein WCO00_08165 [Rhodospirillaceae bacterium]
MTDNVKSIPSAVATAEWFFATNDFTGVAAGPSMPWRTGIEACWESSAPMLS